MKPIVTERLLLRNWEERDRDLFHRINSDDVVMEFFDFRRTREEADRVLDRMRAGIDNLGYGWAAVELRETGECLGFTGISPVTNTPPVPDGEIEIGWRFAPEHWGKGYATGAARAWLRFGFEELGLHHIIAFAVESNERSIAVMKRLGMLPDPARNFLHPRVAETHPHLRPHVVYTITKERWQARAHG
ncbi:GNAT family N-acetyltransferase [Chelativorans composti]|jgi:RimJ/RimL family protein N-acetyltransferase|uniref:GNAT family N-acetyltransferase n=1 Tax=Chelativorans composti TaxID=768533 RepID=A0ABW5DHU8_9HYPH